MMSSQRSLPRDVFMHLLMIAALYASVAAFLALLFQYVNIAFPDTLTVYYPGILDTIRRSEAILLIIFPVYLFLSWIISRDMALAPDLHDFKLRKWLIYFTLFISAITIIVDLVMLIYNFLGGDLTTPFTLKVLAVLATAGVIFGYYLRDLRVSAAMPSRLPRIAGITAAIIVLITLIAGFFIVGSPASQRSRRFDEQRISDLQIIQSQIVSHWMNKGKLPESLAALTDDISGFTAPIDPENKESYPYQATDKLSFELCADFRTATAPSSEQRGKYAPEPALYGFYGDARNDNWTHIAGRACFSRTIDPELYRPQKSIPPPSQ